MLIASPASADPTCSITRDERACNAERFVKCERSGSGDRTDWAGDPTDDQLTGLVTVLVMCCRGAGGDAGPTSRWR